MSNDTQVLTLTDFLLARIAEDEERVRVVDAAEAEPNFSISMATQRGWPRTAFAVPALTVARVLADCQAKRRIVDWHTSSDGRCGEDMEDTPCLTLRILATPYADHPDYRDEWRPSA